MCTQCAHCAHNVLTAWRKTLAGSIAGGVDMNICTKFGPETPRSKWNISKGGEPAGGCGGGQKGCSEKCGSPQQ